MRRRVGVLVAATSVLLATAALFASPAVASAHPALKASRTCVYVGTPIELTLDIPLSYFPPSSPVWGWRSSDGTGVASAGSPVTVDLVAYRLSGGVWTAVWSNRVSNGATTTVVRTQVKPSRGRYRYVARIRSWKGDSESNVAELAVVSTNVVALTFDDGPWPEYTSAILGTLQGRDVRATFFMCGYALAPRPSLGASVVKGGHEVANHTYDHADLTKLSDAAIVRELQSTQDLIRRLLGVTPRWCRPPGGATNARVKGVIESLGMRQVLWDVDPMDWKRPGASVIASRVLGAVRPGYVVLMHDGGGERSGTVAAVPVIIDGLRAKGYDFVTMSELSALKAGL